MHTVIAAAAAMLINLYYWLMVRSLDEAAALLAAKDVALWKDVCVTLLCFVVLCDLAIRISRWSASALLLKERVSAMDQQLAQIKNSAEALEEQNASQELEKQRLQSALEDAQARLRDSDSKQAAVRPGQVDAELVNLLSVLQDKGRFIDFLMEDISGYSEMQIAAAARVVHQGCGAALKEYFSISPGHSGKEGEPVTVDSTFKPGSYRLVGNVGGSPPYKGVLLHKGWITEKIRLPRVIRDGAVAEATLKVITPTQVEVR